MSLETYFVMYHFEKKISNIPALKLCQVIKKKCRVWYKYTGGATEKYSNPVN